MRSRRTISAQPVGTHGGPVLAPQIVAGGQVVDNGVAGNVIHRLGRTYVAARLADDDGDLGLPVEFPRYPRTADRLAGSDHALGRELAEEVRLDLRLVDVLAASFPESDPDNLPRRRKCGRIENRRSEDELRKRPARLAAGSPAPSARRGCLPVLQQGQRGTRGAEGIGNVDHRIAAKQARARLVAKVRPVAQEAK